MAEFVKKEIVHIDINFNGEITMDLKELVVSYLEQKRQHGLEFILIIDTIEQLL
jgi:hypothetical protein